MLSTTEMVKVKSAIEKLYIGKVTITEHQKVKKANKSTGFEDVVVLKDQPCRLSFKTITNTNQTDTLAAAVTQITKVFLAPDIKVKAGSKLTITQNGVTTDYECSGKPAYYTSHQEIVLKLHKGWA